MCAPSLRAASDAPGGVSCLRLTHGQQLHVWAVTLLCSTVAAVAHKIPARRARFGFKAVCAHACRLVRAHEQCKLWKSITYTRNASLHMCNAAVCMLLLCLMQLSIPPLYILCTFGCKASPYIAVNMLVAQTATPYLSDCISENRAMLSRLVYAHSVPPSHT